MVEDASSETRLDATGHKCPIPVLLARRAMKTVVPGAILRIEATDPGAAQDFRAYCETTGDELLEIAKANGRLTIRIRKKQV